jgi:hypothetical protein
MMIDYSDFQAAGSKDWYRIEGSTNDPKNPLTGMSALSEAMREYLVSKGCPEVALNSPVVQMSETGDDQITVTWGNTVETQQSKSFNTVVATPALGCLQRMDLEGLNLSYDVLMGIRTLAYDRATKVAIKCEYRAVKTSISTTPSTNTASSQRALVDELWHHRYWWRVQQ